jgi:NADH dehydrogenase [ubiquinone] 1 alpha subcomplex assembly factor 1
MSLAKSNNSPTAIIDFQQSQELNNWVIVNDTVMGGRSRTLLNINDSYLSFSGILSLENNGGFASIRRVSNGKAWLSDNPIQIQVKGDGREYQLRFRTNQRLDGVHYVVSFKTKAGEASVFQFNQSDFVPQFRGRFVRDTPALDFADIKQIGLMLADGNPGEFMLLVERISQLPK